MRLSAVRLRGSRRSSDRAGGRSATGGRSLAYLVLAAGASLFMLAVIVVMWPRNNDGAAPAGRDAIAGAQAPQAVASDSMTAERSNLRARQAAGLDSDQAAPAAPLLSGACAERRAELAADSERIDRFDLDAVAQLNVRIGLFNSECAAVPDARAANATRPASAAADTATRPAPDAAAGPGPAAARAEPAPPVTRPIEAAGQAAVSSVAGNASSEQPSRDNGWNPTVLSVQSLLTKLGYKPGPSDGLMGKRTAQAVRSFQRDNNLPQTGLVTLELLEAILAAYPGSSSASTSSSGSGSNSGAVTTVTPPAAAVTPAVPRAGAAGADPVKSTTPSEAAPGANRPASSDAAPIIRQDKPSTDPDVVAALEALNQFERQTVEWVCASASTDNNDAAYRQCIDSQINSAREVGRPNLATLTAFERGAIVRLCADERYGKGLAAYYECAQRHQASLKTMHSKPNMGLLSADVRSAVRRHCDGLQFTESLPVYYRCVDTQVSAARR